MMSLILLWQLCYSYDAGPFRIFPSMIDGISYLLFSSLLHFSGSSEEHYRKKSSIKSDISHSSFSLKRSQTCS